MRKLLYIAIFAAGFSSVCFSGKGKKEQRDDDEAANSSCLCIWAPPRCKARVNQPGCRVYCARKLRDLKVVDQERKQLACEAPA